MSCALIFPVSAYFRYRNQLEQQLALTDGGFTTQHSTTMTGGEYIGDSAAHRRAPLMLCRERTSGVLRAHR